MINALRTIPVHSERIDQLLLLDASTIRSLRTYISVLHWLLFITWWNGMRSVHDRSTASFRKKEREEWAGALGLFQDQQTVWFCEKDPAAFS
jgi:hypothetical protein